MLFICRLWILSSQWIIWRKKETSISPSCEILKYSANGLNWSIFQYVFLTLTIPFEFYLQELSDLQIKRDIHTHTKNWSIFQHVFLAWTIHFQVIFAKSHLLCQIKHGAYPHTIIACVRNSIPHHTILNKEYSWQR